jgi:hypothetical protein
MKCCYWIVSTVQLYLISVSESEIMDATLFIYEAKYQAFTSCVPINTLLQP